MSDGLIKVCPECGSASLSSNSAGGSGRRDDCADPSAYRCRGCNQTFDEPETRPRKHTADTRKGLAGRLSRTDPDDVGAE